MDTSARPRKVTILGLGLMGTALAEALLNAGHEVTVWNRTAAKSAALAQKGAHATDSPAEGFAASEITVISVTDHHATLEILGAVALGAMTEGKFLVQLSTITAEESLETARWAATQGVGYLEGSVFGLPKSVHEGTAMILVSGPRAVFDMVEPVLRSFGEAPYLSEKTGAAVTFDRVYYAWVYGSWLAFIQGAAMAHAMGFSVDAYTRVVVARCSAAPERYRFFGRLIADRTHDDVQCRLDVHSAAFAETLAMCRATGVNDALPAAITSNFDRAIAAGLGDKEITAIFEILIDALRPPSSTR